MYRSGGPKGQYHDERFTKRETTASPSEPISRHGPRPMLGCRTVAPVMQLYLDDSGTRHPDHKGSIAAHGRDWFGIGGVMVKESEEQCVRERHENLCRKWHISVPLHSAEIRARSKGFHWLAALAEERRAEFLRDVEVVATSGELTAVACVIDRPGYDRRYRPLYGRDRWDLCKTAFNIVVERAAKYARSVACRLRVHVEASDKKTDRALKSYYDSLRSDGLPFDPLSSQRYAPLAAQDFREILYEFRTKNKSSPLMQIADLCLWPMCIGGYDPENRAFVAMREKSILIDCKVPQGEQGSRGIKYSCWEQVVPKKNNAQSFD